MRFLQCLNWVNACNTNQKKSVDTYITLNPKKVSVCYIFACHDVYVYTFTLFSSNCHLENVTNILVDVCISPDNNAFYFTIFSIWIHITRTGYRRKTQDVVTIVFYF